MNKFEEVWQQALEKVPHQGKQMAGFTEMVRMFYFIGALDALDVSDKIATETKLLNWLALRKFVLAELDAFKADGK